MDVPVPAPYFFAEQWMSTSVGLERPTVRVFTKPATKFCSRFTMA